MVATGGIPRKLGIPGEKEFANKGVSYCATCDAPFFKDKHVIVSGGGNSAAEAVIDLVPYASKITVVHRSKWRADKVILDKLKKIDKLTVHLSTQILEVIGDDLMTGVKVYDKESKTERNIIADGLLIEIGTIPNSYLIKDLVETNDHDEVVVDENQMTSSPGLFAAGDITVQPFKQIIISAAEGAKVALAASRYLNHEYREGKENEKTIK
jgi:NADH-dependent peroxiredoxin subunit F